MLIDNAKNINIDVERWYGYIEGDTTFYVMFKNMPKNTHHLVCEHSNLNVKVYKSSTTRYVYSSDLYERVECVL